VGFNLRGKSIWRIARDGVLIILVAGVVVYAGYHFMPAEEWIDVDALLAHWSHKTNSLEISLAIHKNKDCGRVIVSKTLREIKDDVITQDDPITMFGNLGHEIRELPLGRHNIFDFARPEGGRLPPGHYELLVILSCENIDRNSNRLESSTPARALIVVNEIPVRSIPKGRVEYDEP
jgi:hypothetical protein